MSNENSKTENDQLRDRVAVLERLLLEQRAQPQVSGLPAHPDDIKAANARITADLERRHREHVAKANRAKGHPEPKVGDTFYGWLRKQVRGNVRTREGISFEPGQNVKILVGDPDSAEHVAAAQKAGGPLVSIDGMERIFEDDTLVVGRDMTAVASEHLAAANARAAELAQQNAELAQRNAELEAKVAEAMRNAPESTDGRPSRLPAADRARKQAETPKEPDKG